MARKKAAAKVKKAASAANKSAVQSVGKAFRLLETIAATEDDMTLSELSAASGLDPGTTHRMLHTMTALGYIARSDDKHYTLTLKVLDLGFRAIGNRDLGKLVRPVLRTLVGEMNEAASMAVLQDGDVLYVERVRAGIARLGVDIRVGTQMPAVNSVIGWAILAFLPEAEFNSAIRKSLSSSGIVRSGQLEDLNEQLAATKRRGYALSTGRISPSEAVLAVPILDRDGYPLAAISVAAPSFRISPEELRLKALTLMLDASKTISEGMEASGGTASR